MYKLPVSVECKHFFMTSELYEDGCIHPNDLKDYVQNIEDYIVKVFASLDLYDVIFDRFSLTIKHHPLVEERVSLDLPHELIINMKVSLKGKDFDELYTLYNAFDAIWELISRKVKLRFDVWKSGTVTKMPK